MTSWQAHLKDIFGKFIEFDASMKPLTSLKIGGVAKAIAKPKDKNEIKAAIEIAKSSGLNFRVIGGGTNLLVPDEGFDGLVFVTTPRMNQFKILHEREDTVQLFAQAGVRLSKLLSFVLENAISGLEFAAGIPGTFGGVLWMNAGTKAGEIADVVDSLTLIDAKGEIKTLKRQSIPYIYRSSGLEKGVVILQGVLNLKPGTTSRISEKIKYIKGLRKSQPLWLANAGSTFKNPVGDHAGRLIEACDLKGFRIGDAMVSHEHANFLVNVGNASCADMMTLIEEVKRTVNNRFQVALHCEWQVLN